MLFALIGHRGVGKSKLLKRISSYYSTIERKCICVDLDERIERNESISEIFKTKGEDHFRRKEWENFEKIVSEHSPTDCPIYISLGAGFPVEKLKEDIFKIWICRSTDSLGRVFFDRPLVRKEDPREDYFLLFQEREKKFEKHCDEILFLKEGIFESSPSEEVFLSLKERKVGGIRTLYPFDFKNLKQFYEKRKSWNTLFEIRDDILSGSLIAEAFQVIPKEKILYSLRSSKKNYESQLVDWALENGPPSSFDGKVDIISSHTGSISDFNKYEKKFHIKFSPEINSYKELLSGFYWWQEDKENRSFLPRSKTGKWSWFRLFMKDKMLVNFFKEFPSQNDQPFLKDWLEVNKCDRFGAVLGNPIEHSWSPEYHRSFFKKRDMSFYSINLEEEEWEEALEVLKKIGLCFSAVTSPLKKSAFSSAKNRKEIPYNSVNTLALQGNDFLGFNTDIEGFKKIKEDFGGKKISVWGGGGTRVVLEDFLGESDFYSGRTGKLIRGNDISPEVVIWGIGSSRMKNCQFPPDSWHPEYVVDLNYTQDSPGRDYALRCGGKYISGEEFFFLQAEAQRKLWVSFTRNES